MLKYAMTGAFENFDERLDAIVPEPPKPGDIDCIVTGFPWYVRATSWRTLLMVSVVSRIHL